MPYVISKACTKCAACLMECPTGSIVEGKEQYVIDADTCADHAACVAVCPVNAISRRADAPAGKKGESSGSEEEEN
jgi:NAD-dependent dihydropyrimidine dehydrogenase PreA subunit